MKELLSTGVNIGLEYHAETDALIGSIKGYAVAVKENLQTGSYGCLFWLRAGDYTAVTSAEEFLVERQKTNPEYIKKFRVAEQGVAVALNRVNDDFANVNNLKRFIYDFTASLSVNYYKNCCCECGKTENLAIYSADGVIAQACSECGAKYKFLMNLPDTSVPARMPMPAFNTVANEKPAESFIPTETNTVKAEPAFTEKINEEVKAEPVFAETIKEEPVKSEIDEFILTEQEVKGQDSVPEFKEIVNEAPAEDKNEALQELMFDASEAVIEEETPAAVNDVSAEAMEELMFTEIKQEPVSEPEPEPAPAVKYEDKDLADEFAQLLAGTEEKESERPRSKLFEEAEREFAEEKARLEAEAKLHNPEDAIDNLLIDENGNMSVKENEAEEDDGSSDVTEFRDDSNDGDDFDIEEIESTVEMPTVTTGHPQLEAEETPLEEDGTVPLINPNSHREERHVSPVDGPDAVQPLEFSQVITNESLSEESRPITPPGYADASRMSREGADFRNEVPQTNYVSYSSLGFSDSSNAFMGIIGALTLGLIGLVVWVLIANYLDTISYFGSLAIVVTVFGGYALAGRTLDKKGVVISFLISILMTIAGVVAVSVFEIQGGLEETFHATTSFFEAFEWFKYSLNDELAKRTFLINLGVSLLITVITGLVSAARAWKNA
ncbi:MAG: hypothetical protein J6B08_00590 [Ruminiclostridium sp.]|nr:hypothetical protein [Ruminiclostridium sp.]